MKKMNQKRNNIIKNTHIGTSEDPIIEEEVKEEIPAIDKDWKCQHCHEPCKLEEFSDMPFGYISEISNTRNYQVTLEKGIDQEIEEL